MGIINATPDSFSDGGEHLDPVRAALRARQMATEGASWIDVGGESSRPGADSVTSDEELGPVIPVIERIRAEVPGVEISADTRRAAVAERAIAAGATMINDISAGNDPDMLSVVACAGVAVVLMHM